MLISPSVSEWYTQITLNKSSKIELIIEKWRHSKGIEALATWTLQCHLNREVRVTPWALERMHSWRTDWILISQKWPTMNLWGYWRIIAHKWTTICIETIKVQGVISKTLRHIVAVLHLKSQDMVLVHMVAEASVQIHPLEKQIRRSPKEAANSASTNKKMKIARAIWERQEEFLVHILHVEDHAALLIILYSTSQDTDAR